MPLPVLVCAHPVLPIATDFRSKHRAKSVPAEPNRFVADVDPALVQEILDIPKRKRKPDIHHNRQADDFETRLEVLEWVAFCHSVKLDHRPARLNKVFL